MALCLNKKVQSIFNVYGVSQFCGTLFFVKKKYLFISIFFFFFYIRYVFYNMWTSLFRKKQNLRKNAKKYLYKCICIIRQNGSRCDRLPISILPILSSKLVSLFSFADRAKADRNRPDRMSLAGNRSRYAVRQLRSGVSDDERTKSARVTRELPPRGINVAAEIHGAIHGDLILSGEIERGRAGERNGRNYPGPREYRNRSHARDCHSSRTTGAVLIVRVSLL